MLDGDSSNHRITVMLSLLFALSENCDGGIIQTLCSQISAACRAHEIQRLWHDIRATVQTETLFFPTYQILIKYFTSRNHILPAWERGKLPFQSYLHRATNNQQQNMQCFVCVCVCVCINNAHTYFMITPVRDNITSTFLMSNMSSLVLTCDGMNTGPLVVSCDVLN